MAGKYDNAFPNAQKVQIFEQVDTYIENNNPVDPEIKATIADLKTLDAEFTEIKRNPSHKLATLRKQILNPERHAQAFKAALVEGAKKKLDNSLLATVAITYLDKLSETPDQGA
jgi:hypothetical protein